MKTGTYVDEKIIRLKRFYQDQVITHDPLTEELLIGGRTVRFTLRSLFGGQIRIWLPEDFTVMPEAIAKFRYISDNRPPVILTNQDYDENFGFHLLERKEIEGDAGVDEWISQMGEAVLLHAPETVFYDKGDIPVDGAQARWFEYKNFTLDDETYNLQFLIDFTTYLLAGTFNCEMRLYDQWKNPVLKSLEAIEFREKEVCSNEST